MVRVPVNPPTPGWSLTVPPRLWRDLTDHLFRNIGEHGAVILAGIADGPRGPRLLAREVLLARDGVDYTVGPAGPGALTATFVRDAVVRARDERLVYLAVHRHLGTDTVGFSRVDLGSHERGYPALRQITGLPVGAVVLADAAAAGDLWLPDGGRADLAELVVPGGNLVRLRPRPARGGQAGAIHDRQARLFGDLGQETLGRMRVAIAGLGGVGSILVETLARLGVGALVFIEDETVEDTNLPRLIAADPGDVGTAKVELAVRNARRANPDIDLTVLTERVETPRAREELTRCDWIFLAADSHAARFWVNRAVNQFHIPATQIGVKVRIAADGTIGQIHAVARLLIPGSGCLWCNELIDPTELAIDMHPDRERAAARYVPGVPAPSVIALNGLVTMEAVDQFMLAVTGLHNDPDDIAWTLYLPRDRTRVPQMPRRDPACPWCSAEGHLGRGQH